MTKTLSKNDSMIENLFKAGAHFAYTRSRRHPSVSPYIFGAKNRIEIFDLEKTKDLLEKAKNFAKEIAEKNGTILFVGGKNEARAAVKNSAVGANAPYVADRWIGGTLTNSSEIQKRLKKLDTLVSQKEKGELSKYTKRERLIIDREIDHLQRFFTGLIGMNKLPDALFVVDPRKEHIAVAEAKKMGIPVIALAGSDCDLKLVDFPIPGNDASMASIQFFVSEIAKAYKDAKIVGAKS